MAGRALEVQAERGRAGRETGETAKVGTGRTDVEGGAGLEGREEREKEGGEGEMIRRGWLERVRVGLEGEDAREVPQVEAVVREGGREDEREGASEARVAAGASGMGEGEAAAEWEGEEVGVPAVAVRGGEERVTAVAGSAAMARAVVGEGEGMGQAASAAGPEVRGEAEWGAAQAVPEGGCRAG